MAWMKPPTQVAPEPRGYEWRRNWTMSDEFESNSINLNKWLLQPASWAGRKPGLFKPENVEQKNGALKIWMKKEFTAPDWHFSTGYVRSRAYQKYGYFEISCKLPAKGFFSSAFWLNNNSWGHWTEIDVFENGTWAGQENLLHTNTHIFKLKALPAATPENDIDDPQKYVMPFTNGSRPMKVALWWDEKQIRWILNDKIIRTKTSWGFWNPFSVIFDCEVFPWWGWPPANTLPAAFEIYYVRTWYLAKK